mmetsp:Transcript_43286/g.77796  ORF Transcript_43286/g.77796 Transcript_43286/m.77796 type:complete len:99 (+) Transcript_43286:1005-1301(+)
MKKGRRPLKKISTRCCSSLHQVPMLQLQHQTSKWESAWTWRKRHLAKLLKMWSAAKCSILESCGQPHLLRSESQEDMKALAGLILRRSDGLIPFENSL